DEKILVVSATTKKAKQFVKQVKLILDGMEILAHLRPLPGQLDQADMFDVRGASIAQVPSVQAAGIGGQLTGARATLVIPDDIELAGNAKTEEARGWIETMWGELKNIMVPDADIAALGTPQTEESVYLKKIK